MKTKPVEIKREDSPILTKKQEAQIWREAERWNREWNRAAIKNRNKRLGIRHNRR